MHAVYIMYHDAGRFYYVQEPMIDLLYGMRAFRISKDGGDYGGTCQKTFTPHPFLICRI